jgi:hypothetical protein
MMEPEAAKFAANVILFGFGSVAFFVSFDSDINHFWTWMLRALAVVALVSPLSKMLIAAWF